VSEQQLIPRPFAVETSQTTREARVALRGELDLSTAADAKAAIASALGLRKRLIVDLRDVGFMDSSAVRVLVGLHRDARANGGELAVVAQGGPVTRVLQLCGLERELALVVHVR
jgi:anti-sigma B factor antagonist